MSVLQATTLFDKDTPKIALKSLFLKYDVDENGYLDKLELYKLLRDDLGLSSDQAETYYHLLDKDADSNVSYTEFEKWFLSGERFQSINDKCRYHYLRKAIEMFKKYDVDNNLAIDKQEFHQLFSEVGGASKKQEKKAMKELDIDHNGRVSFQEFLNWLNWTTLKDLQF